jgi:hypothetical protein
MEVIMVWLLSYWNNACWVLLVLKLAREVCELQTFNHGLTSLKFVIIKQSYIVGRE